MSKIHNEYSPINPPAISTSTSQNDGIINGILPARRTINIRGILEESPVNIWPNGYNNDNADLTSEVSSISVNNFSATAGYTAYNLCQNTNMNIDMSGEYPVTVDGYFPAGYYRIRADSVRMIQGTPSSGTDPRSGKARLTFSAQGSSLNALGTVGEYFDLNNNGAIDRIVEIKIDWKFLWCFADYASSPSSNKKTVFYGFRLEYLGTEYTKRKIYWTPSPTQDNLISVRIIQPAIASFGKGNTRRKMISRYNLDTAVDNCEYISLKGFATKPTIESWISGENDEFPFDTYYEELTQYWDSNLKESVEDSEYNFDFDRYLDVEDFPYDVLFECDVDIPIKTANGQQYIEFDSGVGLEEQDIFAIYERKKFDYKFYYAGENGNLYATKSVHYGDSVGNPTQEDAGDNQLPSVVGTTYRLTSSTSGGVTTWTATQAAPSQGDGYTYASTKTAISSSNPWKRRGTNEIGNMPYHTAQPNDTYEYEMNMVTTIPVICVIDGEIETSSTGYGADSNYDCEGNAGLYDYASESPDFKSIESGSLFPCDLSDFYIYKHDTLIPARDTSFMRVQGGWFLSANCTDNYISGNTTLTSANNTPIILYQKTTKMCSVEFDVRSGTGYSFVKETSLTSDLDTRVSYSYTPQGVSSSSTFNLTAPTWLDDNTTLLAPQGTVLKITDSNIKYRYVSSSSETIGDAVSWADNTDNSVTITRPIPPAEYNAFAIHDDYFMVPTIDNVNKPTVNVTCKSGFSINTGTFIQNNKTYTSTLQSEGVYKIVCMSADANSIDNAVALDLSWINVTDSNSTEDFKAFVEDGVKSFSGNRTTNNLFTVGGMYQAYFLQSTANAGAAVATLGYYRIRIDNVYDMKTTDNTYPDNSGKTARISFGTNNAATGIYYNVYVGKGTQDNPASTDLIFELPRSWNYIWWLTNLPSTASDKTVTLFRNFSLYYLGENSPYINLSSISLKSGESKNINTYTAKNANISVDSLKFFRKNNSTSYSPHSETDYTVNIYIDGASTPITKRYTSGGDMSNLVVSGTQITNVEIVDNNTSNLAIFKGLSTDNTDNNIITYPYTIRGDETLYIRWQKPTYGVSLSYMLSDSITASIMSTTLTYDPINGTSQTLYPTLYTNAREANSLKVAIECPKFSEYSYGTYLASDTIFKAIFLDSAGIVCKVGNTTFNDWTISDLNVDFDTIRKNGTISGNTCNTEISYYLKIAEDKLYDIIDDRSYTGNIVSIAWVQTCLDDYNMPIYLGTGQNNFSNLRVSAESGVTDVHKVQYNLIQYDNGNPIYCMKFKIYDNR